MRPMNRAAARPGRPPAACRRGPAARGPAPRPRRCSRHPSPCVQHVRTSSRPPRRPDPVAVPGVSARSRAAQGQSEHRPLLRRKRRRAGARQRARGGGAAGRAGRRPHVSADGRHGRLPARAAGARVRREQPRAARAADRDRADGRRLRRAAPRRGSAQALFPRQRDLDWRSDVGQPPRAVRRGGTRRAYVSVLRRGDERRALRRDDGDARHAARARDRAAAAVLPQPDGHRSVARAVARDRRAVRAARADCVSRHRVSGLRRRPRRRRVADPRDGRCGAARVCQPFVLEELLAVRRTLRRAVDRMRERTRGRTGAEPDPGGRAPRLFEPAAARRAPRLDRAERSGARAAMGPRRRRDARANQADAHRARRAARGARARRVVRLSRRAARDVQLHGARAP
ncbi:Uncharacterised protein [Burkholderia pseudomallei]|nr:Uncharacterised protein [Burkholderia pseudomallei]